VAVVLQSAATTQSQRRKTTLDGYLTATFNFDFLWEDYPLDSNLAVAGLNV